MCEIPFHRNVAVQTAANDPGFAYSSSLHLHQIRIHIPSAFWDFQATNPTLTADTHVEDNQFNATLLRHGSSQVRGGEFPQPLNYVPEVNLIRNITCLFCIAAHPSLKLSKLCFNLQHGLQKVNDRE
ncbi:hypothetical protein Bca52824_026355 [Brassica carinata]|uniref:Uncharacterized protein n=1 Tax=Brassica carinata TaxID=52824 RepID=A0A8X7SHX4_BRACI|nr:hypothetical protein Bca52824_026355 [Brassica carinata]